MDITEPPPALMDAAIAKNWPYVDEHIHEAVSPAHLAWALDLGLWETNADIRDLAATIVHKSPEPIGEEYLDALMGAMAGDHNPYVQYRIAFGLWVRGNRDPLIRSKMLEARGDPEVADIAEDLLGGEG